MTGRVELNLTADAACKRCSGDGLLPQARLAHTLGTSIGSLLCGCVRNGMPVKPSELRAGWSEGRRDGDVCWYFLDSDSYIAEETLATGEFGYQACHGGMAIRWSSDFDQLCAEIEQRVADERPVRGAWLHSREGWKRTSGPPLSICAFELEGCESIHVIMWKDGRIMLYGRGDEDHDDGFRTVMAAQRCGEEYAADHRLFWMRKRQNGRFVGYLHESGNSVSWVVNVHDGDPDDRAWIGSTAAYVEEERVHPTAILAMLDVERDVRESSR